MEYSYHSALILPLPSSLAALHSEIQAIRISKDKAYERWMPHINLLFPFVLPSPSLPQSLSALSLRLQSFPSFRLWFSSVGSFPQGKTQTVHLVPETDPPTALADLYALLIDVFPEYLSHQKRATDFHPHLTLGQWPAAASLADITASLSLPLSLSLSIHADSLHVITRDGDSPFSLHTSLSLRVLDDVVADVVQMNADILAQLEEKKRSSAHAKVFSSPSLISSKEKEEEKGKAKENEKEEEKEEEEEKERKMERKDKSEGKQKNSQISDDVLVRIHVPMALYSQQTRHLVFVCDTSGSMEGVPKNLTIQAVEALEKEMDFEILNYSTKSFFHPGKAQALRDAWQSGSTYFRLAFQSMVEYLASHEKSEIDFCFMTDGQPTDDPYSGNPKGKSLRELQDAIRKYRSKYGCDVTIHSFGLGSQSNLDLLEVLRISGTKEGVLVYASDASKSTKKSSASSDDEEVIISELRTVMSFAGRTRQCDVIALGREYPADFFPNEESETMDGEIWLSEKPDALTLRFKTADGSPVSLPIREIAYLPSDHETEICRLRRDMFSAGSQYRIGELDRRLEEIRAKIWSDVPRNSRAEALDLLGEVERDLDEIRKMAAEKVSAGLLKSDLLGRFKALAFRGRLSKARRAKFMDQRTIQNAHLVRGIENHLKQYPMPSKEDLTEMDRRFPELCDDIYGDSLGDILSSSHSNILVLGLQVERDEAVVDQPVCLKATLCNTLVSWETIEKAADFQMRNGNASASGTFNFAEKTCLLKGINGEELNAGLPLYCNAHHYRRVRALLPLLCGHFFLLSPVGFSSKQIPALFAVLARLVRQAKSERSLMIIEHFRLVCAEIMRDDILLNRLKVSDPLKPLNILKAFCDDVRSHQKSELPVADVVVGLLLAAGPPLTPQSIDRPPAPIEVDPRMPFALAMELIRRHLNTKMSRLGTGGDCFYPDVRKMVTGSDGAAAAVELVHAPFVDENGTFHPAQFKEYTSIQPCRLINEQILHSLSIPADVGSFIAQFGVTNILSLNQQQYDSLLFPSILLSAFAPSNDRYATLIEKDLAYLDPRDDVAVTRLLDYVSSHFDRKRQERFDAATRQQVVEENVAYLMYSTNSIAEFCDVMRILNVTHGKDIWSQLVAEIMGPNTYPLIPIRLDKLAVMLSGRDASGVEVIPCGAWMAGPVYGHAIRHRLRGTEHYKIIEQLDELCLEHQYRKSDVPNRHGHHLSNPLWIADPSNPAVAFLYRKWDQ